MYENRSVSETIRGLQTDAERGLNAADVAERRTKYGPNRLKEEPCRQDCGTAERSADIDSDGGNGDFHDVK